MCRVGGGQAAPFLKIDLVAGTPYYIVIGSQQTFFANCNGFSLYISNPEQAPINDFCENALTLTGLGSNYNATACNEPNQWTPDFNGFFFNQCTGGLWNFNHNGVWYVFENPQQQTVSIEIFNIQCIGVIADATLQIGVWSNTGTCNLSAENFYGCLVTNGNAVLTLNNLPAGNFYMFVDGASGSLCTWEFASQQVIECYPPELTPVSPIQISQCATQLTPVTFAIDTIGSQPAHLYWLLNADTLQTEGLTFTANPAQTTVYTAVIQNNCGTATQNFEVVVIPAPTANISGGGNVCLNAPQQAPINITLTGTPPFAVQFSVNAEPQTPITGITGFTYSFATLEPGVYELMQVQDALCNTGITSGLATITQTPLLAAPVLSAQELVICTGQTFALVDAAGLQTGAEVYWFTQPPTATSTPIFTGATFNANNYVNPNLPDTLMFWAQQQTVNGCLSDAAPLQVVVLPLPDLALPILPDVCQNQTPGSITIATNANITWYANNPSAGAAPIATGATLNLSNWFNTEQSGSYTLWATAEQYGCISAPVATGFQVLPLPPAPSIADTLVCADVALPLLQTAATGWVQWYADTTQTLPMATGATFLPDEPGTYYLRQTDLATGCTSGWAAVEVGFFDALLPPSAADTAICPSDPMPLLTALANYTVQWYADTTQTLPTATGATFLPDAPGTYYLRQTNPATGCTSGWAVVAVSVNPWIQANFTYPQTVYCLQDQVSHAPIFDLPPPPNGQFSISGGATIHPSSGIINLLSTQPNQPYTVTFLPIADCPVPTQFVLQTATLVLPALPDLLIEEGRPATADATALQGANPINYAWQPTTGIACPTCPATQIITWQNQTYTVFATDDNGCTATTGFTIQVYPRPNQTALPNAFSPNGDGVNDVFRPVGYHIQQFEMYLYNRWGELVFTSQNPATGWNGEYKNQPAPMGVYVYYANITYQNGETEQLKGNVTLVR